jgi:para-nitrobenzyl esterase
MTRLEGQIVVTNLGEVRGAVEGNAICFRGIPYAASPIGDLRFAPPQPHPGWAGVRETTQAGPSVPQGSSRLEQIMGHRYLDAASPGLTVLTGGSIAVTGAPLRGRSAPGQVLDSHRTSAPIGPL